LIGRKQAGEFWTTQSACKLFDAPGTLDEKIPQAARMMESRRHIVRES